MDAERKMLRSKGGCLSMIEEYQQVDVLCLLLFELCDKQSLFAQLRNILRTVYRKRGISKSRQRTFTTY